MAEGLQALAPFAGIGLALALGLLIGVERGWSHRAEPDGARVAGIRTFALLGMTGGVASEAAVRVSPLMGAALLIVAAAALRPRTISAPPPPSWGSSPWAPAHWRRPDSGRSPASSPS